MAKPLRLPDNWAMSERVGPQRITIELEPGADPIQGRLSGEGVPDGSFMGWMELATALEEVRTTRPGPEPSSPAGPNQVGGIQGPPTISDPPAGTARDGADGERSNA